MEDTLTEDSSAAEMAQNYLFPSTG